MTSNTDPLPENFRRIELALAREPGHPVGDADHRFTLVAPLSPSGGLDEEQWRRHRAACRAVRRCEDEEHRVGHLVRRPGGRWSLRYDVQAAGDDEDPTQGFEDATFEPGSYVSIREDDGLHTFRVVSVSPL